MNLPYLYKPFADRWSQYQGIWLYSDPHFGDKDLPRSISDDEQLARINSKVGKKGLLILLGDVGDLEYARKLKGYKVLICGNHDVGHTIYEEIFDEVYNGPLFISDKILLSHEPVNLDFAFNIHGHVHKTGYHGDSTHLNCCAEAIDFTPLNMNQLVKSGAFSKIESYHRETIDRATARKQDRERARSRRSAQ